MKLFDIIRENETWTLKLRTDGPDMKFASLGELQNFSQELMRYSAFLGRKKVDIPFKEEFRDLMAGHLLLKWRTSRYKKYGDIGDYFEKFGRLFKLVDIGQVKLKFVAEELYVGEGFKSPEEFKKVWAEIHPRRGYRPDDLVWMHLFSREF